MSQVKFLSGLKDQLSAKRDSNQLVVGALYFCTDEKKIFKAIATNSFEAVNEEVYFGALPELANAFPGKLYLNSSEMTLHVKDGDAWKQLSAPANALVPGNVSENLNAEDGLLLASKAAVKAAVDKVAGDLATEIDNRGTAETQLLADAKADAAAKDAALKADLQNEIDADVKVEKERAETAEQGLAGRLGVIEGEGEGSIKAAVKAEADRAVVKEGELAQAIADEASRAGAAELALGERINALAGDGEGSVAEQVGKVQEELEKFKENVVGSPAKDEQPATGLFKEIADEKAAREGADAELAEAIANEVTRAKGAEEDNADAIANEASVREEADEELQAAIDKLNGDEGVEGSVAEAVKKAVDAEKLAREEVDAGLQTSINNINEALGLGEGATAGVGVRLNTLESKMGAVEGRATALETAVGAPAVEGDPGTPATGLYGEVDALKAKDASLQASIDTLNGSADTEGSVAKAVADEAKLRKEADDLLDGRLDVIEASIGNGGNLESRVAANEEKLRVVQGDENTDGSINKALKDAKDYANQKITDLVNGAPDAMNTLNELAQAISDHQDVYEGYVETVTNDIATAKQEAKDYADTQDNKLAGNYSGGVDGENNPIPASGLRKEIEERIAAEQTRAESIEAGLRTDVDSKVAKSDYDDKVAALEQADTNNLAAAKQYADDQDKILIGEYNTAAENEASNASGLRKEIEEGIAAEKSAREQADNELQGAIDDINEALGLGEGATEGVGTRLNNLEAAVGTKAGADPETQPATGLYGEVDALKAADNALDGRLGDLESVVGDAESGLVKKVDDNAAAIEIINGDDAQEGSIAKALKDAKAYADQAEADAIAAAQTKAGELDAALKTEIEKDDGKLMTAIKAEQTRAKGVEGGLNTRLEAVEASIGKDGALEARVAAVETKAEANKVAIGDESSGLTKDVADNAAAISNNADAISAINHETTGILAQAKADATTKANAAQAAAENKAAELDATLKNDLEDYADDAEASALASAKEYVNGEIGKASVPDGADATGLHKVIEDGDKAAKAYTDNALTWGSFY